MARARREESDEMNIAMGQTTPSPRAASTEYFRMDDDGDVLAARPTPLAEVRPQDWVQRHTVEQIGDVLPLVPALADSVPQMVDRLVAVLARNDMPIAGQVIKVPKVSCPLCSCCSPCAADGGTAGECADDPPLSRADRRHSWSKVFSQDRVLPPLQSRSWTFQVQVVVFREIFKVFPKDGVQQRVLWSRTLTFQFPEVACMISLILALQAHPQYRVMSLVKGFF